MLAVHTSCAIGYYKDPARTAATFRTIDGTAVRDPRRPGDARRRRHAHAARPRLQLHQLGRREDLARGGRGGAEGAPGASPTRSCWACPTTSGARSSPRSSPTTGDEPPDADALGDWVGARLAGYKRPRRFVFADEVGRNTVGKLDYEWARAPSPEHSASQP